MPLYAARAGRSCNTCHNVTNVMMNKRYVGKGDDDFHMSERKRSVHCQTCHINPSGGGLKTAPGRYYARNTLPMFNPIQRPYVDSERTFTHLFGGKVEEESPPPPKTLKNSKARFFYSKDFLSYGAPFDAPDADSQSPYAFSRDTYDNFNADPLLAIGVNVRVAYAIERFKGSLFPMLTDISGAFHPIEHVTLAATGGVQRRHIGQEYT